MKPYTDLETTDSYTIRNFSQNIDPIELMWHRDNEDRSVTVLEAGAGWGFQHDNKLPYKLEVGDTLFILRHEWHRVIKGSGDLLIKIYKHGRQY